MSTPIRTVAERHAMGDMASAYLDALRGVGANLVLASHVYALYLGNNPHRLPLGELGVAVFFLLSGFLIMQSMLNWLRKPQPRLPGFIADRVARIMTPYLPALVLVAVANVALVRSSYSLPGQGTGVFAFLGNLLLLQDHAVFQALELTGIDFPWRIRPYNAAEPFWTIAVEMWIYVSFGLFFFCLLQREKIDRAIGIGLAAVAVPVLVWNASAGGGKSLSLIWLLGALAGYLFHVWGTRSYANIRSVCTAIALFGLVALVGRVGKIGLQPYDFQSATLMAMIIFGVLGLTMSMRTAPGLLCTAMKFLASYSYSLYLIHNTVLIVVLDNVSTQYAWAHVAIAVAGAHVCAYLLYLGFERHYRAVGLWLRPSMERVLRPRDASRPAKERAALWARGTHMGKRRSEGGEA